jgi:hypothetical protein
VYELLRQQDERTDARLKETERKLLEAIEKVRAENERLWRESSDDRKSIHEYIASQETEAMLTAQFDEGKHLPVSVLSQVSNWVEGHWRTLSFVAFVLVFFLDLVLDVHIFNIHLLTN